MPKLESRFPKASYLISDRSPGYYSTSVLPVGHSSPLQYLAMVYTVMVMPFSTDERPPDSVFEGMIPGNDRLVGI